jgi:hypothetical protein
MSRTACPRATDWPGLVAHRFERHGEEPAGFREGLAHLEGCPECRRAALAADPTLLFQRLAGTPAGAGSRERLDERAEADSVRRAVAAMRTASQLSGRRPARRWRRWLGKPSWKRWSAAAVLALAALSTGSSRGFRELPGPAEPLAQEQPDLVELPALPAGVAPGVAREPSLDRLNRSESRVYEIHDRDMTVVMVVGGGIDV